MTNSINLSGLLPRLRDQAQFAALRRDLDGPHDGELHVPLLRAARAPIVAALIPLLERPVVLIAHSLGVATVVQAVRKFRNPVAGAFLVAPPDVANPSIRPKHLMTFGPYPRDPLPFPSMVAASSNDPFCALDVAEDIAAAWGSVFVHAGEAGHFNADSGYGPWPEGTMAFANFLTRLPG